MAIRLDRFAKDSASKANITTPVNFSSKKLQLYEFCSMTSSKDTSYKLYALIEHQGLVTNTNFQCYFVDGSY